jgi:LuxR family maltose regulon positive regulatory protein
MPDTLLTTKISLPILRQVLVTRKKLLRRFSDGMAEGRLLTLVSAPAGYGKTTTIRMWVEEAGCPVAWVTLEKSDNDLKQFLVYVLTALGRAVDELGQSALEAVENAQEINLQSVLGLLLNELYALEQPIILVLEEYHLIENETIDRFVEAILNQAVANLHLVIATREDPNLPLTRLRVRNQLTEIRAADLSFSLEEAADFLTGVMGVDLSDRETEILANRTEGWAAGLQLAALSLKESADKTKQVEAFRGTHRHVLDYLIEEVLNNQSEERREFLRRTSILDQLSASLCEAVTGLKDSRNYLQDLETNNLFLISLDEERLWYRYHALFAELLRNQLMQFESGLVNDLHARAADWYEQNGYVQKAVEHAFQMSNSDKAAELIARYALPTIYQGEIAAVRGWFDRLPKPLTHALPMLHICKAWSLVLMQRKAPRLEEVEQALQAAADALNRVQADDSLRTLVAGHTASVQAFLMGLSGATYEKPERLIEAAQKAQQLLPQDERAIRSVNAMVAGNGYLSLADIPAAEKAFQQTYQDGAAGGNFYAAVYGPINLILLAMSRGRLQDAMQLCETNIARFDPLLAGQRFPPIGALHILKGCILLEENQLAEAERALTQGLSLIRWTGEYRTHIKGYAALARLRSLQGDEAEMLESLNLLGEIRPECAPYARALRHRLSLNAPFADHARLEAARAWAAREAVNFNNLPDITGVDPISETHFRASINAAHVRARLAAQDSAPHSLADVRAYLDRQEKFTEERDLLGWQIEIWLLRALMYQAEGKVDAARRAMESALEASATHGFFRLFLDEGRILRPLLESAGRLLKSSDLAAYVERLLEAMPEESAKAAAPTGMENLSERETDVLRLLADGQSYKEVGQNLFLSLNTVQFHVKSIYRKLAVNKRLQAVEKARQMNLI